MNTPHHISAALILIALTVSIRPAAATWPNDPVNGNVAACAAIGDQFSPTIASDGAGGAIVTWEDYRASAAGDIYVQRISADGVPLWTANGVALCTAADAQDSPSIVSDGAGGAIVTWEDFRGGSNFDIYAQRISAAGAILWTANGVALCSANYDQQFPVIVADGAGGAIVAWPDPRSEISTDIYAQRVSAAGTVMWTADGVTLCAASGEQSAPTIVSDGANGAIIAWYDFRSGTNSDIYAQRIGAAGVTQWTVDGVMLCSAAGDQTSPLLAADGASGAIVTWADYRTGGIADVYAQRISAAGTTQWTANGVALCAAANDQFSPNIVADAAGGAIVTWYDGRSGAGSDIYAQRVSAAGATQWTVDGVAVCTAANDQRYPTIASDNAGGAIVTWFDSRGVTGRDIYAQRVSAAGAIQWIADGAALCIATGNQQYPTIVADGAGNAIVAWYDRRSGTNYDIYVQRTEPVGATAIGEPTTLALRFVALSPTPARGATTLEYTLARAGRVQLGVYDSAGRRVQAVRDGELSAGSHRESVVLRDVAGRSLASGVYVVRLETQGQVLTQRLAVIR